MQEMNFKFNFVRHERPEGSKVKADFIRDESGEKVKFWSRDIHFKERAPNYDIFCQMLTEVACCTQFLGNVADVAKMEGTDLGDAVHFPSCKASEHS